MAAVITVILAGSGGCVASPRDPTGFLQPGNSTGRTGTGGSLAALVGTWRAILGVAVDADLQTWATTWRFASDGSCLFRREVASLVEGITRVRERGCTWVASGGILTATFLDTGEAYPMPWSFKPLGTTTLLLEGVEYSRIPG